MWNWLRRHLWPSSSNETITNIPRVAESAIRKDSFSVVSDMEPLTGDDISQIYCGLILGIHSPVESKLNATEIAAINELNRIISSQDSLVSMVPRLPAVIPQLMQSLRDDKVSNSLLSKQISKDPTLVADVIKMASSPYYRSKNKIKSLEGAITVLGRSGIRHVIVKSSMKPIINLHHGHYTQLASGYIWRKSEYCSFVAQCLANKQGKDAFEAYLAGLIMEIGFIIALNVIDNTAGLSEAPRSIKFHKTFFLQSLKLSSLIASEWELPLTVVTAIDEQVKCLEPAKMSTLGAILYSASLMSQLQLLIEDGRIDDDISLYTCRLEGKLQDSCKLCLKELKKFAEK